MACHHHWNVFPWNCSPASQSLCLKLLHVPSYELEDQDKEQTVTAQLRQPMAPMKELMVWQTLSSAWSLPGHLVFRALVPLCSQIESEQMVW